MRVIDCGENEIAGLEKAWGLTRIFAELNPDGSVRRELGYDRDGNLVHRFPGEPSRASHGVFDIAVFETSTSGDIQPAEFERRWSGL